MRRELSAAANCPASERDRTAASHPPEPPPCGFKLARTVRAFLAHPWAYPNPLGNRGIDANFVWNGVDSLLLDVRTDP